MTTTGTARTGTAVDFETASRVHMGIATTDLERAIAFYRVLLGAEPVKVRHGYAKFETAEPPLNLALNEVRGRPVTGHAGPAHFGIQVKTTDAVRAATERLGEAGIETEVEEQTTCCFAVQNKVWATDPDGHRWEVFVVLDADAATHGGDAPAACCR